jgi:serine protease Do
MQKKWMIAAACMAAASVAAAPSAWAQRSTGSSSRVVVGRSVGSGGYLGVGVAEIDGERAKALHLKEERGVEVKSVTAESAAAKAGVKENDVVLEFNGQPVQGVEQFQRLVRETPPGRQARLLIWRGGASHTLTATLESRKTAVFTSGDGKEFTFAMPNIPTPVIPDMSRLESIWSRSPMLGIQGESLNAQLAEYFGVKDGVLVMSVTKGSAAEKAGLKAGDIIVKVDESKVTSAREITSALRSLKNRKGFPVVVVRNKKEMTLSVTIDDPAPMGTRVRARSRAVRIYFC